MSESRFELPPNMREATPDDVQGVLDAIDTVLIAAADERAETDTIVMPDDSRLPDNMKIVFSTMAKLMHLTPEQLSIAMKDKSAHELFQTDDMERFQVRRFGESYYGIVGMVIRQFPDRISVAHIHETEQGLQLNFDYDLPGSQRATVADCEEIKDQLGASYVL